MLDHAFYGVSKLPTYLYFILALSMAKYIEDRMLEHDNYGKGDCCNRKFMYKTDAILTEMVSLMAKMHRATLRNWNQILMVIGNFAYIQETGIDDVLHKGTGCLVLYSFFFKWV